MATIIERNGKRYIEVLKCEDSAHFGRRSVRYITREFFNARNFLIKYPMHFNYEKEPEPSNDKPTHNFTRNLAYGMMGDPDVVILQDILKAEGLFASNIESTGNYLQVTARAVLDFQNRYGISPTSANDVGPMTRAKLADKGREPIN